MFPVYRKKGKKKAPPTKRRGSADENHGSCFLSQPGSGTRLFFVAHLAKEIAASARSGINPNGKKPTSMPQDEQMR